MEVVVVRPLSLKSFKAIKSLSYSNFKIKKQKRLSKVELLLLNRVETIGSNESFEDKMVMMIAFSNPLVSETHISYYRVLTIDKTSFII